MIVDDEPDLREMVNLLLHKEGFETKTAKDGEELLEKLDEFNPDLVILDVMMPGPTTSEILDKIKTKDCNPKIILLTVIQFSKDEVKRLYKTGNILAYVTKPCNFNQLINTIHKCIMDTITPN
jgi:DNA-binding response OmpR family regulator